METHSVVWGLDIGHTSIKAVKLQRAGDGVVVVGYSIEPVEIGENVDRDEAVQGALLSLSTREAMRGTPVVASLSGRQIFSRTINVPILNPKKVDKMVELEARQQIPGNFEDVRWAYHMSPSADGASNDVALFAARKDLVDHLTAMCRKAGLELVGISVSSLAVYNFVNYDQEFEDDESVVVLDVGAENTDLVVYHGDMFWMRTLGVAGNDITRAFMKKFRVSYEEAETLKHQVGDSRQADRILKVIEPSLAELTSEVQRSIGFYKNQNREANFQNVVVSGNTFRLPGLAQFLADRLGFAIIELVELERIQVAGGLDREHFLDDLQSLGVAMGLGLQGLGLARANVNLLPQAELVQTLLKQKRWAAGVVVGALYAAWLAGYLIDSDRMQTNVGIIRDVEARSNDAKNEENQVKPIFEDIKQLSERINPFRDYASHVGYLAAAEQGILEVVQDLAQEQDFFLRTPPADPLADNGDPTPQTLYWEEIEIPYLDLANRTPFAQYDRGRTGGSGGVPITFTVLVPDYVDGSDVSDAIEERLQALPMPREVWQAAYPNESVPPESERPSLFVAVSGTGSETAQLTWVYNDPTHRDALDRHDPIRDRPMTMLVERRFFECYLRDPRAVDAGASEEGDQ